MAAPLAAGEPVDEDALVATRVRFEEAADLARYLAVDDALPADAVLTRAVDEGELLPRSALGEAADADMVRVPLTLPSTAVLPDLRPGQRVDVYVASDTSPDKPATLALEDAEVVSVSGALMPSHAAERQLVLGLAEESRSGLDEALGLIGAGTVTVVGRG